MSVFVNFPFLFLFRYAINVKRYLDRFGAARVGFVHMPRLSSDLDAVFRELRQLLLGQSSSSSASASSLSSSSAAAAAASPSSSDGRAGSKHASTGDRSSGSASGNLLTAGAQGAVRVVRLNAVAEDPEGDAAQLLQHGSPRSVLERPALRRAMARYYAPWNTELERLTGLRLGWNDLPM